MRGRRGPGASRRRSIADPQFRLRWAHRRRPRQVRPSFSFPPMRAFAREGGWLLLEDVGFLFEVSPAAGVIRGAIQPGLDLRTCVRFATVSLWVALLECLRARGRYLIHAAGAIDSQGDLVLLVGPSGVGKTTTAISLLELGWTALGDNLLFLELDARGRVSTLAHRHDFHVGDGVMQRRSGLRRFVRSRPKWEPQDKQLLQVQAAFPGRVLRRWGAPARDLLSRADRPAPIAYGSARRSRRAPQAVPALLLRRGQARSGPRPSPRAEHHGGRGPALGCFAASICCPIRPLFDAAGGRPVSVVCLGIETTDRCDLACAHCLRHVVPPNSSRARDIRPGVVPAVDRGGEGAGSSASVSPAGNPCCTRDFSICGHDHGRGPALPLPFEWPRLARADSAVPRPEGATRTARPRVHQFGGSDRGHARPDPRPG